ncbi:MAG: hypothetical protein JNK48_03460 [Bryobacterales bacterium]|nr:hypothetical protein [Bryobacterales bacterium]
MKVQLGLVCLLAAIPGWSAAPPLQLTIVSHNEEPSTRQMDYLASRAGYLRNRELVRQLALVIQAKGAKWSFQSDWNFLLAVAEYDTGTVVRNTNGKNILRWLVEDLRFEVNPHAHESKYNYADVGYLVEQLGLPRNQVVGGFLYWPAENPQGWEQHENGIFGVKYPAYFWRAELLWGAATPLHQGADEESYGLWHPKDKYNFTADSAARRLVYIGGGCKSNFTGSALDGVEAYLRAAEKGRLAADGFYTATIMINQGQLTEGIIQNIASHLEGLRGDVAAGRIVHRTLSEAFAEWRTGYGARAYRMSCAEMEGLGQ